MEDDIPTLDEVLKVTQVNEPEAKGAYGAVFKLRHGEKDFAVKRITVSEKTRESTLRERDILEHIKKDPHRCPFTVDYCACFSDVSRNAVASFAFLVFEWKETTLKSCTSSRSFEVLQRVLRQLAEALHYLHKNNIVHRDVKPANILLTSSNLAEADVRLSDFGFAKTLRLNDDMTEGLGTCPYAAPEIIKRTNNYNAKVDVWSFGIVAYELLTGARPFTFASKEELKVKQQFPLPRSNHFPAGYEDVCQDFAEFCLRADPEARPTMRDVLAHPFFDSDLSRWVALQQIADLDAVQTTLQRIVLRLRNAGQSDAFEATQKTANLLSVQLREAGRLAEQHLHTDEERQLAADVLTRISHN